MLCCRDFWTCVFDVFVSTWRSTVIVIFASISWNSETWRSTVVVIFALEILLLDSYSVCVKNLKTSREWFKKSMIWWLHCLLLLISRAWFSIWWLTTNWVTMSSEFEFSYYLLFFYFYSKSMSCLKKKKWFKRERRRNRDRIEYTRFDFENLLDFLSFHFTFTFTFTFTILNAQLNRAAVSENVSDTIQFFMRRKFLTISSTKVRDMTVQVNYIVKRIASTKRAQHWTRHDLILTWLFLSQLYHQKDCICRAIDFRYVLAVRLVRDLSRSWLFLVNVDVL